MQAPIYSAYGVGLPRAAEFQKICAFHKGSKIRLMGWLSWVYKTVYATAYAGLRRLGATASLCLFTSGFGFIAPETADNELSKLLAVNVLTFVTIKHRVRTRKGHSAQPRQL
jgi:hypothetical protein